jgi:hypothetical protein
LTFNQYLHSDPEPADGTRLIIDPPIKRSNKHGQKAFFSAAESLLSGLGGAMDIGRVQRHRRHTGRDTSHERSHLLPKRGHSAESYPLVGADEINAIYLSIPVYG